MLRVAMVPILMVVGFPAIGWSQKYRPPSAAMLRQVGQVVDSHRIAALSVAMVRDARIVWRGTWGSRGDAETPAAKVDTNTVFGGASFTKTVFAYTVLRLVDAGKMALDTPLYRYLPKPLPAYEKYADLAGDERWRLLTPRMVLSHTTGFPNWRSMLDDQKLKFLYPPGTRFGYSGEGINLLQEVVEQITSQPLARLTDSLVFRPLGMQSSSMVWDGRLAANRAYPRGADGKAFEVRKFSRARAAGSMATTPSDYARFVTACMQGKGLSKRMRTEMYNIQARPGHAAMFGPKQWQDDPAHAKRWNLAWGLGFGQFKGRFGQAAYHTGHDDGVQNFVFSYPKQRVAIVFMSSSDNFEAAAPALLELLVRDTAPWQWLGYIQ